MSQAPEIFLDSETEKLKKLPLLFYIKKNRRAFAMGMIFLLCTNSLDAIYPLVLKRALDEITAGVSFASVVRTCALFFLVLGLLAGTRFLWRVFFGRYHTLAAEDLRNRTFAHFTTMGPQFFQKNPVGELISLVANDIQSFRQAIGPGVLILADGFSLMVILLPIMLSLNAEWTLKTLIFLPLVPFLIWIVTKLIFNRFKIQQDQLANISGYSQEVVAGIRVIKSFSHESLRLKLYNKLNKSYEEICNRVAHVDALFLPVMQFGVASGTVILIFIAADDLVAGLATAGTFVAFQRYITKMVWPMTALGLGVSQYQKGMASFARVRSKLNERTDIPDLGKREISGFEGLIVRNLSFTYETGAMPVLQNLSFDVKPGETIGITGAVGSGKSTLLHLLARLLPAANGCIQVNGLPLEEISLQSLRRSLVLIPQDPFLFSISVAKNVSFGSGNTDPLMVNRWINAVDLAQEVADLPQGMESQLGERGVNLSGGQKQRLTLARGFAVESPLLMIDDALSAVDSKTEDKIEQAILEQFGRNVTKIIVSHRVSTLKKTNRIIILEQGRIEAIGTPEELLGSSPIFRELERIQTSASEFAGHP